MFDRIESGLWWDRTWSLVSGCNKVSCACDNCWLELETRIHSGKKDAKSQHRYGGLLKEDGSWNGRIREMWQDINKVTPGQKPAVWTIWSDLFHGQVSFEFQYKVFERMILCPQHFFIVCTKRPHIMSTCLEDIWLHLKRNYPGKEFPALNIMGMTTVETQEFANVRIPQLLKCNLLWRGLSAEPLLEKVDLCEHVGAWWNSTTRSFERDTRTNQGLDWVIVGGESGKNARPMHPDWAIMLRDQCSNANIPFFFKQWGEWVPVDMPWLEDSPKKLAANERYLNVAGGHGFHGDNVYRMRRDGKTKAGRLLSGGLHNWLPRILHTSNL